MPCPTHRRVDGWGSLLIGWLIAFHRVDDASANMCHDRVGLHATNVETVTKSVKLSLPASRLLAAYLASSMKLSEWLLNSGAYMHCTEAMPV